MPVRAVMRLYTFGTIQNGMLFTRNIITVRERREEAHRVARAVTIQITATLFVVAEAILAKYTRPVLKLPLAVIALHDMLTFEQRI